MQIPIVYDDFEEDDETFYVVIESIVAGDVGIGAQRCCVTIRDCGAPRKEMEGMVHRVEFRSLHSNGVHSTSHHTACAANCNRR